MSKAAVNDALEIIEADAFENGCDRRVNRRVEEHEGSIYFDLGDRVVEINRRDWKVIKAAASPVLFARPDSMQALPKLKSGGRFEALRTYLNVAPEEVVLAYTRLIAAFWPSGP